MASPTPALLLHVYLGNTFGAIFIGAVFAAILFGVSVVQAFIYFQTHRDTGITLFKLVVIYLWTVDALHLAFVVYGVYYYLVTNYANFEALTEVVWSGKLQIVFTIFTVWSIHLLYAYRIWIGICSPIGGFIMIYENIVSKGRSRALPIAVGIIVTIELGVAIVPSWKVYQCHLFTDLIGIEWSTLMCLCIIAFTDFVIASSLCYLLATSRTGFSSTDSFLTKLMVYTINTGFLTSMCSLAACITCAVMPNESIYISIEFVMSKLYVNSFFAFLNARYYMQPNIDTAEFLRDGVYRPELRIREFEDDKLQASKASTDVFKRTYKELHPTCPSQAVTYPQRPIAVTMEESYFSQV